MKYFSLALLTLFTLRATSDHDSHGHHFTLVSGTEIIDGHNPGVNADILVDIFKVRNAINELLQGQKKNGIVTSRYQYKGASITLTDLSHIFDNLEAQGVSHTDPDYIEAQQCLSAMMDDIIKISDALLAKEAKFIQNIVIKIVHTWAHKSGRNNSFLLQWGRPDERALFKKLSAHDLRQFCVDLKNFLYDLMFSCPKARQQFKEKYLTEARYGNKHVEKRAAFDHSFKTHD